MVQYGAWTPYEGNSILFLAAVLLIIAGILMYLAVRLQHPIAVKRPGMFLGITIVVIWLLSLTTFLVAVTIYVTTLYQQVGHFTGPTNPITPITISLGLFTFIVWALFGFAYPASPIPFALNAITKVLAFATAISLFLPQVQVTQAHSVSEK